MGQRNLQSGCIRAIGKLLIRVNGNMYLAFVITWLPFLEFNCYFRKVTKRGYLHFQCNSKGLSYILTILHLAGFNSPPPLFFFWLYIPPISYLLCNNIEPDLFNLSLWVSCHGVEIEHFNMSRLGVLNHSSETLWRCVQKIVDELGNFGPGIPFDAFLLLMAAFPRAHPGVVA